MEPIRKRPRLSIFANMDPDPELDQARHSNDMVLKARFEAIFEKYARDFSGIGDIVDLNTGQVDEDNGHLRGINNEKDPGQSRSRSPHRVKKHPASGTSLLRALTVAPDRDDSYFDNDNADDVIMSIENIAANAAGSDEDDAQSADESGDDLFDVAPVPRFQDNETPYASDPDSLFEVADSDKDDQQADSRLSSPDSLFDGETPPSATQQNTAYDAGDYDQLDGDETEDAAVQDEFDERAIYAKFGRRIGKQVLQLLNKRDKAELHIDPAWRIPVNAQPRPSSAASSHDTIPEEPDEAWPKNVKPQDTTSPQKGMSVWAEGTRRTGSRWAARAKAIHSAREESEDPLQEGFHSDSESDEEIELERCNIVATRGVCPYCQEQYVDRVGVMQHLNREAKSIRRGLDRGEHDPDHIIKLITYIHKRAKVGNPGIIKGPRLLICDYKTMVELHEGAEMSFQEIIDSDTLLTLKNDPELLTRLYSRWRDIDDINGKDGQPSKEWTTTENIIVNKVCRNKKTSMEAFARKLRKRTHIEIGNKLADVWLTKLRDGNGRRSEEDQSEEEAMLPPPPKKRKRQPPSAGLDGSWDDDEPVISEAPSQSFDTTFAAAMGMTALPEQIPGLPPMPQSVVRNTSHFEPYGWHPDDDLADPPLERSKEDDEDDDDNDLFVPNIWA